MSSTARAAAPRSSRTAQPPQHYTAELLFFASSSEKIREGANRGKRTVKKIINNEMFFFTVYVPYKP